MKAVDIKKYLGQLNKFNEWELEQRQNYDPQICVKRVAALYDFALKNFSPQRIEKSRKEHLDNLIRTQSIFLKIKEKNSL
ncbi:TPA: hypothetical protein DCR49_07280 [Candidatus Delongbacteria bacterium]|nr:hypothetical protein [Candidatus Delongbacteria bacterium]